MSVDFLDSNVFVYLFDQESAAKRRVAEELIAAAIEKQTAVISFQVVQEVLNVLTRKLKASPSDAQQFLDDVLCPLWVVNPTPELYHRALEISGRYRYSLFDAQIIAGAITNGCSRVLSENLQDGQTIDGVRIVNPFA